MNLSVLTLNADYMPLNYNPLSVISWKDAIVGVMTSKFHAVEYYDKVARSPSIEFKIPSVVALNNYYYQSETVKFSRYNVFLRDRFTCQYCNKRFFATDLTFDHLIPKSKGGITSWENIVTSCRDCNSRKGDLTLEEARMSLNYQPFAPTQDHFKRLNRISNYSNLHNTWIDYIYWDSELETN